MRKHSIRCVDQGTVYDVTGKMRSLVRSIENGEEGTITDVVIIARRNNGSIGSYHYGHGNHELAHWMVSTVKNRLEPS
jgi:hypothetical protein